MKSSVSQDKIRHSSLEIFFTHDSVYWDDFSWICVQNISYERCKEVFLNSSFFKFIEQFALSKVDPSLQSLCCSLLGMGLLCTSKRTKIIKSHEMIHSFTKTFQYTEANHSFIPVCVETNRTSIVMRNGREISKIGSLVYLQKSPHV